MMLREVHFLIDAGLSTGTGQGARTEPAWLTAYPEDETDWRGRATIILPGEAEAGSVGDECANTSQQGLAPGS